MISPKFADEEIEILDMVKHEPVDELYENTKKHENYTLKEDKVLEKVKSNLERGGVIFKKTPKGGATMAYLNPGDFKIVMDTLVRLKVGQKFTIDKINAHVSENCTLAEKKPTKMCTISWSYD